MQCEMCGQETSNLTVVETEGTELEVCENCTEFGTVIESKNKTPSEKKKGDQNTARNESKPSKPKSPPSKKKSKPRDMMDQIETLASDYNDIVRDARETSDLTQEELSDRLNEKLSLIKKIESGDMRPDEDLRRKLENELGVALTMEISEQEWEGGVDRGEYTLGDIIKRKDE